MKEHEKLIDRYNARIASNDDIKQIETLIENGTIDLSQLEDISAIQHQIDSVPAAEPEGSMDTKFYTLLADEKRKTSNSFQKRLMEWWDSVWQFELQWAYSLVLMIIGGIAVYTWQGSSHEKINQLTAEMGEMKELMMLNMLEKNSTTDRLKAVSLTNDMKQVSDKVAAALIDVLRNDENNNVRLAAIESLAMYTDDAQVRKGLVESIQFQKSPLVQLALAELMVAINEKKSVKEFKTIIDSDETPGEIKVALENAMQVLI